MSFLQQTNPTDTFRISPSPQFYPSENTDGKMSRWQNQWQVRMAMNCEGVRIHLSIALTHCGLGMTSAGN